MAPETQYLTPKQLMARLNLSENVIYRELEFGFLRGISRKCGRQWRTSAAGLDGLFSGDR